MNLSRFWLTAFLVGVALVALLPLVAVTVPEAIPWISPKLVGVLNLFGWSLLVAFLINRRELHRDVGRVGRTLGIDVRFRGLEALLGDLLREVERKNSALSVNLVEKRITTHEELSRTLERIVAMSFRLLDAESAELALFDRDSGMYHTSFVLGKPFRTSAQAMLSGAAEGDEDELSPDVLVQPIAFAGTILGTLRVGLRRGRLPSQGDREIMELMALQGSMAMINAQYNQELVRMKLTSDESVKAKTGFLANLSHEIRGPLGIMMNAVELVLDGLCGSVTKDQTDTLQMARSNCEHLLDLVNDVLDYAKVESGKVVPEKVEIFVQDLLKDITDVVRVQADAKSHKLKLRPSSEAFGIRCDRRHARQMLINLLTNAIKYTPDGGEIEVWCERVPGNKVKISVRDSGVGIEESDRGKVFAAFERVDNAYSIKQLGTGLGMPLTRKLVEMNGGQIDFLSSAGKGTTFWVIFQAIEMSNPSLSEETKEEPHAAGKGERILLVEKDDGERGMMFRYLTHLGFSVTSVQSREEALRASQDHAIELAIIDNAVIEDGAQSLVGLLRQRSASKKLPIVLVSSRAFVFDIEKYLKAGIDRCLIKPVPLKELGSIARALLDGSYSGPVVDQEELPGKPAKKESKKDLVATKVARLDDILH